MHDQPTPTVPPTEIIYTEDYTDEERKLLNQARDASRLCANRTTASLVGFITVCIGIALIVLPHAWDLIQGHEDWNQFGKTAGFCGVLFSAIFLTWQFAKHVQLAHSTIAKLDKRTHCPACRTKLIA